MLSGPRALQHQVDPLPSADQLDALVDEDGESVAESWRSATLRL